MANNKIQKEYLERAQKAAFYLQFVPFVRAVFLTGSLARGEARKESDIDFFIVTAKERIWTCRALVTLLIELMGIRRTDEKIAGRICLNRYQTEDYLEIEPHNAYHKNDYSQVWLLSGEEEVGLKYQSSNKWIGKFKKHEKIVIKTWPKKLVKLLEKIISGKFGNFLEKKLKKYQKNRILKDPRTAASKGKIRVNDKVLAFHPIKDEKKS